MRSEWTDSLRQSYTPCRKCVAWQGKSGSKIQPDGSVSISNTGMEVNRTALTICFTRNISQVRTGHGPIYMVMYCGPD